MVFTRAPVSTAVATHDGSHSIRAATAFLTMLTMLAAMLVAFPPVARAAGTVTLQVREYDPQNSTDPTPAAISSFRWMINEDNANRATDPTIPSLSPMESYSPIVATGDETTASNINLPNGRYLFTVEAPGHKLWGEHFSIPDPDGIVRVGLIAEPVLLADLRVHVFEDNASVNGQDDGPITGPDGNFEDGQPGFEVVIYDAVGEVTVDWFGDPLCGGRCVTDANGDLIIHNLAPNKFEVQAIPPDDPDTPGPDWIQTSTIEGTNGVDAWLEEGSPGFSEDAGFRSAPAAWFGFVQPKRFNVPAGANRATVTGTVKNGVQWIPPTGPGTTTDPVVKPWIALSNIGTNDRQVYTGRGNADGTFSIPGVPAGTYQLAVWDEPLDYIISFETVIVTPAQANANATVTATQATPSTPAGLVRVPRWFGMQSGTVFNDVNSNGIQESGEAGLAGVDLDIRHRDGSIQYATFTNSQGKYQYDEVFPFGKFLVSEVGFGRFWATEASGYRADENTPADLAHDSFHAGEPALLASTLTWAGMRSVIDWGKRPYEAGENGGVSGIVFHATTRNEFDPRLAAAEDYEPGIPEVTVQLWGLGANETWDGGTGDDVQLNEVTTDHFEHPTGCDYNDQFGDPIADPAGIGPDCHEVVNVSNEIKEGVFDGGYAFTTDDAGNPLEAGDYVVKVIKPTGYQVVREQDQNTDQGDDFVPAVPPSACVGGPNVVNDPRNPFDGQTRPLCDERLITIDEGGNTNADFFLFAENGLPVPGRVFGLVTDDLNVETNPTKINYAEKAGLANVPVSIRDFSGRALTTVVTDENGYFDVLVPSTENINCPTPGGVCPGMYKFVANDPGDPGVSNPSYDPRFSTLNLTYDVTPGKTTYADIALIPLGTDAQCLVQPTTPTLTRVSNVVVDKGTTATYPITITGKNFGPAGDPDNRVTLVASNGTTKTIVPTGTNWTNTQIQLTSTAMSAAPSMNTGLGTFPSGPAQLLVRNSSGNTTPTGVTVHVRQSGTGNYNPAVRTVGVNPPGGTIQDTIDGAPSAAVVVVPFGRYQENVILYKGIRLQGVGAGEPSTGNGGTVIDGSTFPRKLADWEALMGNLPVIDGAGGVPPLLGAGVTVVSTSTSNAQRSARVDGLRISGATVAEAGGIYAHAATGGTGGAGLSITNNVVESNGGTFGGGLTLGQPYVGDNNNDNATVRYNRILHNGGSRLAGGVGIFNGADSYEVDHNEICGNFSAEYGGGLAHSGNSPGGEIHHNRILGNEGFDEGGGLIVGGELRVGALGTPAGGTSSATGIDIRQNLIEGNLSNDDGGGIRLLAPLTALVQIRNNMIVNNVATDIGGGIALDDASNVQIVNNTIANNDSTSTAVDATGAPRGAGITSTPHSSYFTPGGSNFSNPVLFNNIFWQNHAYGWNGATLTGPTTIDLEVVDLTPDVAPNRRLSPRYSLLTVPYGGANATDVIGANPGFMGPYANVLNTTVFFQEPNFVTVELQADVTATPLGNYHLLSAASPAKNLGVSIVSLIPPILAPAVDFDDQPRNSLSPPIGRIDAGADEV
jgi:parallel beta-helix repeat protein